MESPLPRRCARSFALVRPLARGAFGSVHLAHQRTLDREVAIKVLHTDLASEPEQVARFLEEARITASLASPHVVQIIDHDVEDGVPWIAYEYLPGPTLRQRLDAGPLPWRDAVRLAAQVAAALEVAHERGVLHRDIKPDNVIEAHPGHVKVTDFGLARFVNRAALRTQAGLVLGTPAYLAPEVALGHGPSASSDIYALGILLHELLAGSPPFSGPTVVALLDHHISTPPPAPGQVVAGIPSGLDAIVAKALAKAPTLRFYDAAQLRTALESLTGDSPGVTERHPRPALARTVTRRGAAAASTRILAPHPPVGPPPTTIPRWTGRARASVAAACVGLALIVAAAMDHRASRRPDATPSLRPSTPTTASTSARAAMLWQRYVKLAERTETHFEDVAALESEAMMRGGILVTGAHRDRSEREVKATMEELERLEGEVLRTGAGVGSTDDEALWLAVGVAGWHLLAALTLDRVRRLGQGFAGYLDEPGIEYVFQGVAILERYLVALAEMVARARTDPGRVPPDLARHVGLVYDMGRTLPPWFSPAGPSSRAAHEAFFDKLDRLSHDPEARLARAVLWIWDLTMGRPGARAPDPRTRDARTRKVLDELSPHFAGRRNQLDALSVRILSRYASPRQTRRETGPVPVTSSGSARPR